MPTWPRGCPGSASTAVIGNSTASWSILPAPRRAGALALVERRLAAADEADLAAPPQRAGSGAAGRAAAAQIRRRQGRRGRQLHLARGAGAAHPHPDDDHRCGLSGHRPDRRRARARHPGDSRRRPGAALLAVDGKISIRGDGGRADRRGQPGVHGDHAPLQRPGQAAVRQHRRCRLAPSSRCWGCSCCSRPSSRRCCCA